MADGIERVPIWRYDYIIIVGFRAPRIEMTMMTARGRSPETGCVTTLNYFGQLSALLVLNYKNNTG